MQVVLPWLGQKPNLAQWERELPSDGVERGQIAAVASDKKLAKLEFLVVKESNGKPVRNAAVVLHSVDHRGNQAKGGLELKTSAEGKASIEGIPFGKLRVQVLAPHFKTFGEDYDITQPNQEINIKLQAPSEQYTIYK